MRKRILALLVTAITAVLLCGCSLVEKPSGGRLQIVTTIFPAYDFARQVFGDKADITLLLKPGTESHSYDPSARDIVKIDSCDLFIYNGGESDAWVDNVLKTADEVNAIKMMSYVEALEEEELIGAEEERDDHDHGDEEYDEHIWTSPKNAALIVDGIKREAVRLDIQNRVFYEQNAAEYSEKILDLDRRFNELLTGESRYFVFGDRFPLLYFFKEYNLNYYAAFPGCGSETEPSAQTIAFLTEKLSESGTVDAVFCIELSNRKLAETLADENGLPVAEFHTCHNITADDFAAGESYVSLMERNYRMLKNALDGGIGYDN
ncbi:MAG: metal ABC transporter substrate-binding protein [Oscillospiraceae bacterium]|nr:metal ABC transporter substrate-binding protein [Oscillospiraceae bacterium]